MPAIQGPDGKWKWGKDGQCVFDSKQAAEEAGRAIRAQQSHQMAEPIVLALHVARHGEAAQADPKQWILGVPQGRYPKQPRYGELNFTVDKLQQYHDNLGAGLGEGWSRVAPR